MFLELFFLIFMLSPLSNCLGRCVTTQENKHLECTNLYEFPQGSDSIEVLKATNGTLIKISSDIFLRKQFVSLKAAILQYDNIRSITKRGFNGLSSLVLLDLTRNELEELNVNAFEGAESLKVLILSGNRIQYLHQRAFADLSSLIYLDLSRNNISDIPRNLFKHLPSLKYLDISRNPLNIVSPGTALASTSLAVLRISFSRLQEISPKLFADLPNLQVLDLSGSNLKVWPDNILYPLSKLRVLYVDRKLLVNEEMFVPSTVEKFTQTEMNVDSDAIVRKILENLDEFNAESKGIDVLQFLEDDIEEVKVPELLPKWKLVLVQKILLFSLLVYLSFMYTICVSQIVMSFIHKPYQRIYIDEI
ncbi:hypothetical protein ILUMI_19988 [Ignelater luminosus]|uniref:Uncharacterized protein n=1 Tax=Ignelater luminosus TaxID=2038154 RepID=A0A8K0FZC6_IGNLU|nr:hypothetical protein ILUMI_19988 [Ignelater luminosus]